MKHEYSSSVERHMQANLKVWGSKLRQGSIFSFQVRIYTSFYTEIKGKTRVQNTRGTREMELTESRVQHEFDTRVLACLSSCSARWQHGILFTG